MSEQPAKRLAAVYPSEVSRHPHDRIDPDDPRAPSSEAWQAMSPEQRAEVVRLLPAHVPWELVPPEGDFHRLASETALDTLDTYFKRRGRSVYLSSNLAVYYPGEWRFAPDLIAVLDVEPSPREKWVVAAEGKGLDFAMEVLVKGSEKKDLRDNVERFARVGIPEYFVLDVPAARLSGWRLTPGVPGYVPIAQQAGRWHSAVLDLDLMLEGSRIRFYAGSAELLMTAELVERANRLVEEQIARREEEAERAEREAGRAEREAERASELERRLAEALAELERLKGAS